MTKVILGIIISFVLCVGISPILIPYLRKLKFGQQILEIGPNWHKNKAGTPTMGGIAFIISTVAASLVSGMDLRGYIVLIFAFLCGVIGFVDDFIKVCLKRNMGFNARQKTMCLLVVIFLFMFITDYFKFTTTEVFIPFLRMEVDFKLFYYPLVAIGIFYMVNSVNLTDGVDGLAGSVTLVVSVALAIFSFVFQYTGLSVLCASLCGGLAAFLIFNLNPAKMFMGDTGSLFLGGLITGVAVAMGNPLIILVIGIIYVIESLSVVIQVTSFKLTGKRVFKMTPIHHHFEMSGFNENKIVILFTLVTIIMCVIGFFGVVNL